MSIVRHGRLLVVRLTVLKCSECLIGRLNIMCHCSRVVSLSLPYAPLSLRHGAASTHAAYAYLRSIPIASRSAIQRVSGHVITEQFSTLCYVNIVRKLDHPRAVTAFRASMSTRLRYTSIACIVGSPKMTFRNCSSVTVCAVTLLR